MLLILFFHLKGGEKDRKRGNVSDYLLIKGVNEVCESC